MTLTCERLSIVIEINWVITNKMSASRPMFQEFVLARNDDILWKQHGWKNIIPKRVK